MFGANCAPVELNANWLTQTGIRHARIDCSWSKFEPREGEFDDAEFTEQGLLGRQILLAHQHDMTVLPILAGIPDWAQSSDKPNGWSPPADPEKWAHFVDRVVGHFSKPPYNQKYWQVWNEAPAHPFWPQNISLEHYIEKVHNPAAKMVRKHGGKVVWGGWPSTHWQDGQYAKALDMSGAGELTDILDAHYVQGLRWFERGNWSGNVYQRWLNGSKAIGCWQTEMGWTFAEHAHWLTRTYFQDISWALHHNWNHKDKYRNYFFHYYAAQPNRGFYWNGPDLKYPNGFTIRTLMHVTRGDLALVGKKRTIDAQGAAVNYNDGHLQLTPILAGGRLVMLPITSSDKQKARFSIALRSGEQVRNVKRVTCVKGDETDAPFTQTAEALHFELNNQQINGPKSAGSYIIVTCDKPLTTWN
jgi:hypothetical protein